MWFHDDPSDHAHGSKRQHLMLSMTWLLILASVIPFTKPCWILVGWMILKKCESSISGIKDDADASAISSQDVYDTSPTALPANPILLVWLSSFQCVFGI